MTTTKSQAIAQAEAHADSRWMRQARLAVHQAALHHMSITADDVWAEMTGMLWSHLPQAPTAMGPIMLYAERQGWIEPTDRFRPSRQASNHQRPVRLWGSLIYGKE